MSILQRYVLREISWPIVASLFFFTFLMMVSQLFKLTDLLLKTNVSGNILTELLGLITLYMVAYTLPMAMLLGSLIAFGRLAQDREILAVRAAGLSLWAVYRPVIYIAMVVAVLLTCMNAIVVPIIWQRYRSMLFEIKFEAIVNIQPKTFVGDLDLGNGFELTLFYDRKLTDELGSGRTRLGMGDIAVRIENDAARRERDAKVTTSTLSLAGPPDTGTKNGNGNGAVAGAKGGGAVEAKPEPVATTAPAKPAAPPEPNAPSAKAELKEKTKSKAKLAVSGKAVRSYETMVFARRGYIEGSLERKTITLELQDGTILPINRSDLNENTAISFSSLSKVMREEVKDEVDARELTVGQLLTDIRNPPPPEALRKKDGGVSKKGRELNKKKNELLMRFSVPISCIAFVAIGMPLGVVVRRGAKSIAFAMTFSLMFVYYLILSSGRTLGEQGYAIGWFLIFAPNLLLGGIGIWLMRRSVRH